MNRELYEEIVKYIEEKIDEKWDKEKVKALEKESKNYIVKYGKLFKEKKEKTVKVLKENEKEAILWLMHDHPTAGHFGIEKTYEKISKRFYWKNMKKEIEEYIKSCEKCQRRGNLGGKGFLNPIKVEGPWKRIGMDFVGPLRKTSKGNKYILVITDYLTKWPEAKALKEATAEKVVEYLYEEIICRHGCPEIIMTDRGSHFDNKLMEELSSKFNIKHKKSSPYHPQTNGLVERFNKTLCESLAKVSEKENQWDKHINEVLFAYRTSQHSVIRQTPFYLMYGREAILPIEVTETNKEINEEDSLKNRICQVIKLQENQIKTIKSIEKQQEKPKNDSTQKSKRRINLKLVTKYY